MFGKVPRIPFFFLIVYLGFVVLLPLSAALLLLLKSPSADLYRAATSQSGWSAIILSSKAALVAAILNSPLGFILAWVLARYSFPCKRLVDSLVDLPFSLPAVVAGIALMSVYGPATPLGQSFGKNGEIGKFLATIGFGPWSLVTSFEGLVLANLFVTLPFVVRTVQPAILELDLESEEAAHCLGASPLQIFFRILLPQLLPAIGGGFGLAFARGVNEYGIAVLLSGNIPGKTMLGSVYIYQRLEAYDYGGATVIAALLMLIALAGIAITGIAAYLGRRHA